MKHESIEKNIPLMSILVVIVISIGAIIEIFPLFWIDKTIEKVEGIRPYTPLELRGRDIYVREGCYNCHSQMIRPFRDEWERYGHYSLAAESKYDHPFQWASKRTGPDLARVGGKYSSLWHQSHMRKPQSVVPESVMPHYPWLEKSKLEYGNITGRMNALNTAHSIAYGETMYTEDMIANAKADLEAQATPDSNTDGVTTRYGNKVAFDNFDGKAGEITELDALVAYLQMLGTLVDFTNYKDQERY
ncbi:cytochrome c oxidase, cbb3-type, subunit II [Magnetococcus marinus MC-1]|uniref:Cytochrome c oxidase, cbb3-type, subunit II n=2 Tax=Magnetococcus TaxID=162171 RepID=A0LA61_MAGMM|nr:cytochrome-c oxidase, cbb3-type subunit II [Magnetococcus marinus]ABK44854.1 cytochrome c oxidase, cbb3-type, subunit II [Magnetococcus marinus MC-1]